MSGPGPASRQPAVSAAGGVSGRVFTIGEVLSRLRHDFESVTASKVRFLEEKGLIAPQRTPAGYRKYTHADIERLRFILALQRDRYLPLKVIKEYCEAIDRGERPENLPAGAVSPRMVSPQLADDLSVRSRRLSALELRRQAQAPSELLQKLVSFGLISPVDGYYNEHDLAAVRSCVQLQTHGIEPRHLRAFRVAADRELSLVEQAISPLASRRDTASRARAAEAARELSEACLALHRALVNGRIDRLDE